MDGSAFLSLMLVFFTRYAWHDNWQPYILCSIQSQTEWQTAISCEYHSVNAISKWTHAIHISIVIPWDNAIADAGSIKHAYRFASDLSQQSNVNRTQCCDSISRMPFAYMCHFSLIYIFDHFQNSNGKADSAIDSDRKLCSPVRTSEKFAIDSISLCHIGFVIDMW